jgi:hypothetical protein
MTGNEEQVCNFTSIATGMNRLFSRSLALYMNDTALTDDLMSVRRIRPGQNNGKLPGLAVRHGTQRTVDPRAITYEEISDLKLKAQEFEAERKLLRAKVQRMRKIIQNRSDSIRKVLNQPVEEQAIRTATESTLQQLREEKTVLEHTLEAHTHELIELRNGDKVAQTKELKVAIPVVFAEMERMKQQVAEATRLETVLKSEIERLQEQIAATPANERAIDSYQLEIDNLTEKLFAYRKSEMKILTAKDLQALHENPSSYDEIKKKLEDEIRSVQSLTEADRNEIPGIQESEARNLEYLNGVIQEQCDMIRAAIDQMTGHQTEDVSGDPPPPPPSDAQDEPPPED